jgi:hypothetical protein
MMVLFDPTAFVFERSAVGGGLVAYGGSHTTGNNIVETIGSDSSTAHGSSCQFWGVPSSPPQGVLTTALSLDGGYNIGRINFTGIGSNPAIRINGTGMLEDFQGMTGTTSDVGLDLTPFGISGNTVGAILSMISITGAPTLTGSNGDIRLPDGTIITWAQAENGIIDAQGNQFIGAGTPGPIGVLPAGTTIKSLTGSGTQCVTATSTGLLGRAACLAGSFYQTWTDDTFTPLPQETFSTAGAGLSITDDPGDAATVVSLPLLVSPGSCTNCSVTFDNFGRATVYSSGAGSGVTSVTGTAGHISASPTTGAVVVDLIATSVTPGSYTYATFTVDADGRLTAASSGTAPVTSIGVTPPITTTGGTTPTIGISLPANQVAFGTGTNVTSSPNLKFDGTNLIIGPAATGTAPEFNVIDNLGGFSQLVAYPSSGANIGYSFDIVPRGTGFSSTNKSQLNVFNTDFVADPSNFSWAGFRAAGSQFIAGTGHVGSAAAFPLMFAADWFATGTTNANQLLLDTNGHVDMVGLAAGGIVKAISETPSVGPVSGAFSIAVAGVDYQSPLSFTGGTVNIAGVVTLANVSTCSVLQAVEGATTSGLTCGPITAPTANGNAYFDAIGDLNEDSANWGWNDSTHAANINGDFLVTNIAAPSTPAAGKVAVYTDSTSKNIAAKDDAGNVNHGARTFTCSAHQFKTALADTGVSTCAQPAFSDLSGSATCAQLPALTGDVTTSAGSCATTLANIPNDTPAGGDILFTAIAAPATPAAGKGRLYEDSTSKNIAIKNASGVVNHGAQTLAASGAIVTQGLADDGSWSTLDLSQNYPKLTFISYFSGMPAATLFTSGWAPPGASSSLSTISVESPVPFAAAAIRVMANITVNTISAGSTTIHMTRNGANPSAGGSITIGAGTNGAFDSGYQAGITSASGDVWGLFASDNSAGATGTLTGVITFYVY